MAAHQPPTAPRKVFREEAHTDSVQCPACGGPITLRGFGAIERVACPYCGSELAPEDSGALSVLQQAQRQRRESVLPLHARGEFEGVPWEIIGIIWRECNVDGVVYPWQEFLLFNPYKGYRWLVFQMTDGHWTLGEALKGAPQVSAGLGHKRASFKKTSYKHFQTVLATTSYVEGEFPWQVHVGDTAVAHEYIAPPQSISIEETKTQEGQDVAFTSMNHIEPDDVWKAFGLQGSPPPVTGVGTVRPNPWKQGRKLTWISLAVFMVLWLVAAVAYIGSRDSKVVFERTGADFTPVTETIQIGEPGKKTTLEFELSAPGLSNAWAAAEVMLVPEGGETAIGMGVTAEEWHGVSGGEAWREGDKRVDTIIGGVEGGTYLLQVVPAGGTTAKPNEPPAGVKLDFKLKQDVPLARYVVLAFFVILGIPLVYGLFSLVYESRRWANSDYVSSG